MNDFDSIASFYDRLANLVFGGRINHAKQVFITDIPSSSRVLILGGGTGQILDYLSALDTRLSISYVELSSRMVQIARQRKCGNNQVDFVLGDYFKFETDVLYDVVICDFFLDLFGERNLEIAMTKISSQLKPNGFLFVSDFQIVEGKIWQHALSSLMHLYFRLFAGLESKNLLNIDLKLKERNFVQSKKVTFYRKFIFSALYIKNNQ